MSQLKHKSVYFPHPFDLYVKLSLKSIAFFKKKKVVSVTLLISEEPLGETAMTHWACLRSMPCKRTRLYRPLTGFTLACSSSLTNNCCMSVWGVGALRVKVFLLLQFCLIPYSQPLPPFASLTLSAPPLSLNVCLPLSVVEGL